MDPPTLSFRGCRIVDSFMGMDGEGIEDSTRTGDRGIFISNDAQWIPVLDDAELSKDLRATLDSISSDAGTAGSGKHKTYDSSDNPIAEFAMVQQDFLDEMLRLAGLADSMDEPKCALCDSKLDAQGTELGEAASGAGIDVPLPSQWIFRCRDCGEFLQCKDCCLERHSMMPLHFLKEWTGSFWADQTLNGLGLVYQLGHQGGRCVVPDPTIRSMVVLDSTDYVTALERMTNTVGSTGMKKIPDCYKAFLRMLCEYAWLLRAKRAGRGHDPAGLAATKQGECAVVCWACPYDGHNLPADWREVDAKYGYLYRLILAIAANFKLKNCMRTNERDDPSLGPGWGAFVEPSKYKEHLKNYIAENDVSTCIAFTALTQKETRNTSRLRVSGVGGLGDLQKGERYANMDFILMSSLAGFDLEQLTISYDIACQWQKNLASRICKLPADMQLDFESFLFQCSLPVWHASSHETECTNRYSLSFIPGVGKTDGEGIERLWAELSTFAFHTKNMGIGHRADTLNDKINYHNFMKNLGQAGILQRKLMVAIAERERQIAAWKEVNKSIPSKVRTTWQERIDAFHKDQTKPNLYLLSAKDGPTEAEIRVSLKKDEEDAAAKGMAPLHGTSATVFLTAGLQLEDTQRRIKAQISGLTIVTADRESQALPVLRPAAVHAVEREERSRVPEALPVKAKNIRLFLPSELTDTERAAGCQEGLAEMEAKLREAQCNNTLVKLRAGLHAKRHVIYWKSSNITGKNGATQSQTLVGQINDHISATATKYREVRRALLSLKGADYAPHLQPLKDTDLTLDSDVKDDESAAKKKLAMISAGKGARTPRHLAGTSRTVMSWIWSASGALDATEDGLHKSLSVEWVRAKSRKNRWDEEVNVLREEMRRVMRYLEWETWNWNSRAEITRDDLSPATQAGLKAYTLQQAHLHGSLRTFYFNELSVPLGKVAVALALDDGDLPSLFADDTAEGL
ncbi:hypothetical protein B0H13DRAFT_1873983 [Mycena leptocephala]|nr:hypothetical protein B0H13DRAFT_1873983 [Mycena leptocephala]